MTEVIHNENRSIENCITDAPITIFDVDSIYPFMPADEDTSAIILSRVLFPTVIHRTNANEVNENTNVIHAAAIIEGVNSGNQRFLNLENLLWPLGKSRNCSSSSGSNVERTGSQKRITNAILNHACETIKVHHQVDSLVLKLSPWWPTIVRIPIAAIIDGMTKGIVKIVLIKDSKGHLYLPSVQAIGIPIKRVKTVEKMA